MRSRVAPSDSLARPESGRTRRGSPATAAALALACAALVSLALAGCASRFAPSNIPLPARMTPVALHPDVVTNGDVIEVAYFVTSRLETQTYRIDVGDALRFKVADYPDLGRDEVVVMPDGTVSLDLIGSLHAVGRTMQELALAAEGAYRGAQLHDPRVVVSVLRGQQRLRQFMQFLGADRGVNKIQLTVFDNQPIELPLIPRVGVDRPLAAIRDDVRDAYAREFGDQLGVTLNLVRRAEPTLYVMGEVRKPGAVTLSRPVNLLTAIAMAGGFDETADEGAVLVVRFKPDGSYDHWTFNLRHGLFSEVRPASFQLRGNDVIYVARSPIAEADLFVRQYIRGLLPFDAGVGVGFSLGTVGE